MENNAIKQTYQGDAISLMILLFVKHKMVKLVRIILWVGMSLMMD